MRKFEFWVNWLKAVSVIFSLFGILLSLLNQLPIFTLPLNKYINSAFWASGEVLSSEIVKYQNWIYCLIGAVCLMIGILIFCIVNNPFRKKEMWAWNCLFISTLAWFAIDETASIYFGVYANAIFNIGFFLSILIPLILTKKYFYY